MWFYLSVALVLALVCAADKKRYDGHKVFSIQTDTHHEYVAASLLADEYQDKPGVDIWKRPETLGTPLDIQIPPELQDVFDEHLMSLGLIADVKIENLEETIQESMKFPENKDWDSYDLDWTKYHNLADIHAWLDDIAGRCGADCETFSIGQSYEGRELKMIKITRPGENRRSIYIDSCIHAREWITPALSTYMIGRLILDADTDEEINTLRDAYDWYFLPVVNPDGYDYSWTTDRMWRKTRKPNTGSSCVGVDGNRNFDFYWGISGSSTDPCSQNFRGPSAASESEIAAVGNFLEARGSEFDLAVTMHSYAQIIIIPWGYTSEPPVNIEELLEVADIWAAEMETVYGTQYEPRWFRGLASGTTMDFAKGKGNIRFSYLLESRDTGDNGFILPPEQILPTALETWTGFKAMAKEVKDRTSLM